MWRLHGTLEVQSDASVVIIGEQHESVSIEGNTEVSVIGELHGTTSVNNCGTIYY